MPTAIAATFKLHLYRVRELIDGSAPRRAGQAGDDRRRPDATCWCACTASASPGDVFHSLRCDCGGQLRGRALEMIEAEGCGVVVLYHAGAGGPRRSAWQHKIHAYQLQEKQGLDTVEANERARLSRRTCASTASGRRFWWTSALRSIRLLTNNPKKIIGLDGFGLKVVRQLPIRGNITPHNARYLETKKLKLGHLL
jgi:3,4-dihydroxy 2-butanone 4-phosphate synthase/GTP cyclohydrolase II